MHTEFQYDQTEEFPDGTVIAHRDRSVYFIDEEEQPVSVPFEGITYIDEGVYAVRFTTGIAEEQTPRTGCVRRKDLDRERYEDWRKGIDYLEEVRSHSYREVGPVYPAVENLERKQEAMVETARSVVLREKVRATATTVFDALLD